MAELNKSYKCNVCGNIVKVIEAGIGELACCGQPMAIVEEQAAGITPEEKPESTPVQEKSMPETPAESSTAPVSEPSTTEEKPEEENKPSF
jgi:desulfoferrodoxin-like iron-binding protein